MNGRVTREFRRQAARAVDGVRPAIDAALGNEQKTRFRVGLAEKRLDVLDEQTHRHEVELTGLRRAFLGRLRWVFLGR